VDASGNDGNASMSEQVKRSNAWMMMMMMNGIFLQLGNVVKPFLFPKIKYLALYSGLHAKEMTNIQHGGVQKS